jgi:hypothetical protein
MSGAERNLVLFFRLTMAWTFLYAASHQVFVPEFSVVGFLKTTKTFHDVFAIFTTRPWRRSPPSWSNMAISRSGCHCCSA